MEACSQDSRELTDRWPSSTLVQSDAFIQRKPAHHRGTELQQQHPSTQSSEQ